jgi:hypothetical protein
MIGSARTARFALCSERMVSHRPWETGAGLGKPASRASRCAALRARSREAVASLEGTRLAAKTHATFGSGIFRDNTSTVGSSLGRSEPTRETSDRNSARSLARATALLWASRDDHAERTCGHPWVLSEKHLLVAWHASRCSLPPRGRLHARACRERRCPLSQEVLTWHGRHKHTHSLTVHGTSKAAWADCSPASARCSIACSREWQQIAGMGAMKASLKTSFKTSLKTSLKTGTKTGFNLRAIRKEGALHAEACTMRTRPRAALQRQTGSRSCSLVRVETLLIAWCPHRSRVPSGLPVEQDASRAGGTPGGRSQLQRRALPVPTRRCRAALSTATISRTHAQKALAPATGGTQQRRRASHRLRAS